MHHMRYCLEEALAEIDAVLEQSCCVRALAQLDRREAQGDDVSAIAGTDLREHINRQIEALPLKQARNRIVEAKELVVLALGSAEPQPVPARGNVVQLVIQAPADDHASGPAPAARPAAPQFKTMRERLAEAVGNAGRRLA